MYIGENLHTFSTCFPDKVAIFHGEREVTYAEFYNEVNRYKAKLHTYAKLADNLKVALFIGNEPAFLKLFFAIVSLGWIAIPIDPRWTKREIRQVMAQANPEIVVASKQFNESLTNHFPITFYIDEVSDTKKVKEMASVSGDTLFYLGFTSGSTGVPKGFMRDHHSWIASFEAGEKVFGHRQDDIFLAPGPLCYSLSLYAAVYALHIGASFYLMSRFSKRNVLAVIARKKKCTVYAVPTMLQALCEGAESISSHVTFISSGAKLHPSVRKNLLAMFPRSATYEYYGASELSFVTYMDEQLLEENPHSVGRPFPGVQLSIRNEERESLVPGEIGAIFVASPFTFQKYLDSEETARVVTEHGVTIGDVGYVNDDGLLFIVGREKNMIICGGQNVYPEEIEKILLSVEFVKEAVVIGVPHDYWGEQIIALIQWKTVSENNMERLRSHSRKHLAIYKRPHKFIVVDTLAYTSAGKVNRKQITEKYRKWIK